MKKDTICTKPQRDHCVSDKSQTQFREPFLQLHGEESHGKPGGKLDSEVQTVRRTVLDLARSFQTYTCTI